MEVPGSFSGSFQQCAGPMRPWTPSNSGRLLSHPLHCDDEKSSCNRISATSQPTQLSDQSNMSTQAARRIAAMAPREIGQASKPEKYPGNFQRFLDNRRHRLASADRLLSYRRSARKISSSVSLSVCPCNINDRQRIFTRLDQSLLRVNRLKWASSEYDGRRIPHTEWMTSISQSISIYIENRSISKIPEQESRE